ncbi:MAG: cadherin-like beta sandwich domain-containing protein [Clostridia bacterium]|nr:cadherin-like beta sandwich domain-containing protein [Clostridia bacterium]
MFCAFSLLPTTAFAASSATVSISAPAVTVEKNVTVTLKLSSSDNIGSWTFFLDYDPSYLEYVSGADNGGGGKLHFTDSTGESLKEISFSVVFKTKKIGTTRLSVNGAETTVVGFDDFERMNVSDSSGSVTINPKPVYSGDHNLSSLLISASELSPAFSPSVTQYAVNVPFEVTKLFVSATTAHAAARVDVNSPDLVVGENTVTVTVTAENGSKKVYTVLVTRQESPLAGIFVTVDGKDYSVAHDPLKLTPPEGFLQSTATLDGKEFLCYDAPQKTVSVAYLTGESGSGWFVFHREEQNFTPMLTLLGTQERLVILPLPKEISVPEGFRSTLLLVDGQEIPAYVRDDFDRKSIALVYAMRQDGSCALYYYDSVNRSFVDYFKFSAPVVNQIVQDTVKEEELNEIRAEAEKWKEKNNQSEIFSIFLGIVIVLLAMALVAAITFRRRRVIRYLEEELARYEIAEEKARAKAEAPAPKAEDEENLYGSDRKKIFIRK